MQMQGSFNAQTVEPKQSAGTNHPVGRFPFTVTAAGIEENKNKDGGFYIVEFTTPAGVAINRYNMWNKNPQAVSISEGQLSALCHATGRYNLNWQNEGREMIGAQGMIEVGFQKGNEPSTEKPQGGFTEIKKVMDMAGNAPGETGNNPAQQQQQNPNFNAPMTSNGAGGWNNPNPAQQNNANPNPNPNPAPNPNAGGGWQQGGGANPNPGAAQGNQPPWGNRS